MYNHRLARTSTVPLTQLAAAEAIPGLEGHSPELLRAPITSSTCHRWAPVTLSPPARPRAEAVEQCCPSHLPGLSPQHCWARWAGSVNVFFKKKKLKQTNLSGPQAAAPSCVLPLWVPALFYSHPAHPCLVPAAVPRGCVG